MRSFSRSSPVRAGADPAVVGCTCLTVGAELRTAAAGAVGQDPQMGAGHPAVGRQDTERQVRAALLAAVEGQIPGSNENSGKAANKVIGRTFQMTAS